MICGAFALSPYACFGDSLFCGSSGGGGTLGLNGWMDGVHGGGWVKELVDVSTGSDFDCIGFVASSVWFGGRGGEGMYEGGSGGIVSGRGIIPIRPSLAAFSLPPFCFFFFFNASQLKVGGAEN